MQLPNADRLGKLPLRADVIAQQRRLRELEERVRKQNQAHWQQTPVKDDETEGWLLSYLDLLTLLLVMFVALLTLSGGQGSADASADADAASLAAVSASGELDTSQSPSEGLELLPSRPLLVGSTALPPGQWEEAGNLTWIGLMPGGPALPIAPPLPFDTLSPVEAPRQEAAPLQLALDMPYTPVPALAALAPPRPADSQPMPTPAASPDNSSTISSEPGPSGSPPESAHTTPAPEAKGPSLLPDGLDLALLGDGIDVIVRERSVSFRISSELLFGLGQTDLTPGGQDVLKRVLAVIQATDLPITVEGHTDPIPIRNERFPSNWELSTARATSVLRRLIDGGIDPSRLRAIGYADTRALASNDTAEGRALNRRVEVILEMPTQAATNEAPSSTLQESQ